MPDFSCWLTESWGGVDGGDPKINLMLVWSKAPQAGTVFLYFFHLFFSVFRVAEVRGWLGKSSVSCSVFFRWVWTSWWWSALRCTGWAVVHTLSSSRVSPIPASHMDLLLHIDTRWPCRAEGKWTWVRCHILNNRYAFFNRFSVWLIMFLPQHWWILNSDWTEGGD